jgi:hypothetical protein
MAILLDKETTQPDSKIGLKFDNDKVRLELLPFDALMEVGKVLTVGAKKYGSRNWEKGIDHSRLYGAAFRHLAASVQRQDIDDESGLDHLAHCACEVLFLLAYHLRKVGKDDR